MNSPNDSLAGRVALVTGSSRGIGAAIARRFARHGASVAVHGRDPAALAAVHGEIERDGGRAIRVAADVTSYAEIETMRLRIERELGPVEEISEEGWRASVDVNLTATFLTIKSVLPGMKQRRSGHIVTLSSAKAGIEMLTRDLALQAGPSGIQVNGIAPKPFSPSGPWTSFRTLCGSRASSSILSGASARQRTSRQRHASWSPRTRAGARA